MNSIEIEAGEGLEAGAPVVIKHFNGDARAFLWTNNSIPPVKVSPPAELPKPFTKVYVQNNLLNDAEFSVGVATFGPVRRALLLITEIPRTQYVDVLVRNRDERYIKWTPEMLRHFAEDPELEGVIMFFETPEPVIDNSVYDDEYDPT